MERSGMRRRRAAAAALVAMSLWLGGCFGGGAAELLDTARLEERQANLPHARELYEEIVRRYPDSPEAAEARARLAALAAPAGAQGDAGGTRTQ